MALLEAVADACFEPAGLDAHGEVLLLRVYAVAVVLLESDAPDQYRAAAALLQRCASTAVCSRVAFLASIDGFLQNMKWSAFPGLHALCLRGLSAPAIAPCCVAILTRLTPALNSPVVHAGRACRAVHVAALLPFLVQQHVTPLPATAAVCAAELALMFHGEQLSLLSKLMHLYAAELYPKTREAWIGDVVKHFCASPLFAEADSGVVATLLRLLDACVEPSLRAATATVLAAMFHHIKKSAHLVACGERIVSILVQLVRSKAWADSRVLAAGITACRALNLDAGSDDGLDTLDVSNDTPRPEHVRFFGGASSNAENAVPELLGSLLRVLGREVSLGPTTTHARDPERGSLRTRYPDPPRVDMLASSIVSDADPIDEYFTDFSFLDEDAALSDTRSDCGATRSPNPVGGAVLSGSVPSLPLALEGPSAISPYTRNRLRRDSDPAPLTSHALTAPGSPFLAAPGSPYLAGPSLRPLGSPTSMRRPLLSASQNSISSADSLPTSALLDASGAFRSLSGSCYVYRTADTIEDAWSVHVAALLEDGQGGVAVQTFGCFGALFKVWSLSSSFVSNHPSRLCSTFTTGPAAPAVQHHPRNLSLSCRQDGVCLTTGIPPSLHRSQQLLGNVELLECEWDLPYVYLDAEALMLAGILERLKMAALEISDQLDVYLRQRADATQLLSGLREALLMRASGPDGGAAVGRAGMHRCLSGLRCVLTSYIKMVLMLPTRRLLPAR
jgi:hypothetical protein